MTQGTGIAGKMEDTLAERGSRYGSWRLQSQVTQQIKRAMVDTPNWDKLPDYLREAFDQIANKMARVLSGDWMYHDNLHDMVGYARLAEECVLQDVAAGMQGPCILDPDNLPWEMRLAKALHELGDLGFNMVATMDDGIHHLESRTNEHGETPWKVMADYENKPPQKTQADVRRPSFMRDPIRAVLAGEVPRPRTELADWVKSRLDAGEPVHLYIPHNRVLAKPKREVLSMYGSKIIDLLADVRSGMVDAYSVEQDLTNIQPAPRYLGVLSKWSQ